MSSIVLKIEVPEETLGALIKRELQIFFANVQIPEQEKLPEELNSKEACKLIPCSRSLLYKLTAGRKIPHSKRGKNLVFKRKELLEWKAENEVTIHEEIRGNALSLLAKRRR